MTRRRTSLAFLTALLVQLLCLPLGRAQLLPNTLPACAKTCTLLQQAQSSCDANPDSAAACFCQSALLAPIKTSGSGNLCSPACSTSDWNSISGWYKSACANPAAPEGLGTPTTTTAAANGQKTSPTATAAAATTTAASSSEGSGVNQNQTGTEWWNTHWQWIVMVIVLVIAFTAIGVTGRIWYRRRHKKVDGEIVETPPPSQPPDMAMWAPSRHSVHDFTNVGGGAPAQSSRERPQSTLAPLPTRQQTNKGKHREGTRPPMPARTPSQRLKAAMESVQM